MFMRVNCSWSLLSMNLHLNKLLNTNKLSMKLCPKKPSSLKILTLSNEIILEEFKIYFVLCTGYYCPVGSSQPLSCSLGQYCGTNELSSPTGNCSAGYFCNGTASVPNPRECDMGYYCPEGTTVQIPCSPGTFSSKSFDIHGLKNLSLYKKRDLEFCTL